VKLAAVSVDLDEIPNYFAIHGLTPDETTKTLVYDLAVPRLLDLARSLRIPMTLFAVGQDLAREASAKALREAAELGHEMGNHTRDHRYDLVRLSRDEMWAQIEGGAEDILRATGRRPRGFRAPGYTVTDALFEVLGEVGVAYDSSVFPCPAYWLAKTSVVGLIRMRGRESQSIVDTPMVLTAPMRPYRIGRPYYRPGSGLVELPIQVTRGPRFPVIGTSLTLAGPTGSRLLASACVGEPLVNLELHGIDVLEANDGLQAIVPHQIDLRVRLERKLASLEAAVLVLKRAGYTFVTLEEAAEGVA
jgi:hypothetical protein